MNIRMVSVPVAQYKGASVALLPGMVVSGVDFNLQVAAVVIGPPNTSKHLAAVSALGPFPWNSDIDKQFAEVFRLIDLNAELGETAAE